MVSAGTVLLSTRRLNASILVFYASIKTSCENKNSKIKKETVSKRIEDGVRVLQIRDVSDKFNCLDCPIGGQYWSFQPGQAWRL